MIEVMEKYTRELCDALYTRCLDYISGKDGNRRYAGLQTVAPKVVADSHSDSDREVNHYYRWQAKTAKRVLSVRATTTSIEFFLVPSAEANFLSFAEHQFRSRGSVTLERSPSGFSWMMDGVQITPDDLRGFLKMCLDELVDEVPDELSDGGSEWSIEKRNLVYKIVNQQEEIKTRLARELHDTIIADLMMLRRHVQGDQQMSPADVVGHLDEVVEKLREICQDFAPRNLGDWGLKTSLQAMVEQVESRSGIDCSFICDSNIPDLPDAVQLHIYRIVQEALNNVEKYAGATRLIVQVKQSGGKLIVTVTDDGKGFDAEELSDNLLQEGGIGMSSMKERAELIRCFFPTQFGVSSNLGQGTEVSLQIVLNP